MGNDEAYVTLGLKVWRAQIERADKLFGGLSSEEVLREIAAGRNRLLYLWGHLTAIHDAMLPLLRLRERLYPEFDVAFVSNPDKSRAGIPSHEQVRRAWNSVNGELSKGTLQQYVGRLHRLHENKKEVLVYDYSDLLVPTLARMYKKRLAGYSALGYLVAEGPRTS